METVTCRLFHSAESQAEQMGWNEEAFAVEGVGYVRCTYKNITSGGRDEYAFRLNFGEIEAEGLCECYGWDPCDHKLQALDDALKGVCNALKQARADWRDR